MNTFRDTGGLVATFSSAQNIDRLVTVYRAARRAGRTLVVDLYTATVSRRRSVARRFRSQASMAAAGGVRSELATASCGRAWSSNA